jgi:tRNA(Ile)-lysidine synthase
MARELRYKFLREVKNREGFELIATAHHSSDLVETIIIWMTRGTGMEGLIGFEPKEKDLVRPLYLTTKNEILAFAKERSLSWVEDSSNYHLSLYRNRIRHKVVPIMKSLNPKLEDSFLRMRDILKKENEFLHRLALQTLEKARISENTLLVSVVGSADVSIQRRVIGIWLSLKDFRKIEQVRRLLDKGGCVNLGTGRRVVRKGKYLFLESPKA